MSRRPVEFFIDSCFGHQLDDGLKAFGEKVTHLTEHFAEGEGDPEWLRVIGDKGLVLVTRDLKIRWRPLEIKALREHRVGAFFLGGKNMAICQTIQQVVRNWPRMKDLAAKTKRPFMYRVPPKGVKIAPLPFT